jgi:hypothetical protein
MVRTIAGLANRRSSNMFRRGRRNGFSARWSCSMARAEARAGHSRLGLIPVRAPSAGLPCSRLDTGRRARVLIAKLSRTSDTHNKQL